MYMLVIVGVALNRSDSDDSVESSAHSTKAFK